MHKKNTLFIVKLFFTTLLIAFTSQKMHANPSIDINASSDGITVVTQIKYFNNVTLGLDPGFDVGNFGGAAFDIYTHLLEGSTGDDYTIQSLPTNNYESMVIPLGLTAASGKTVTFSATFSNLPTGIEVYLEDKTAGTYVKIDAINTYEITLTASANGIGRFYIHTKPASITPTTLIWQDNGSTDWSLASNWNNNQVPTSSDDVYIPNVTNIPAIASGTNVEVQNLIIAASSAYTIPADGGVIVNGNLEVENGITISSTTTNSGVLVVKGTSNAQITYERGGLKANQWSIVSSPVVGQSIKDFVEDTNNNIRINNTVTPNRYAVGYYNDTNTEGSKWTYYTVDDLASNTITFEAGKSYAISRATDGSVTFTGTLNTTSVNAGVAESEWNAVGNPYTAFLPVNQNADSNFINDNINNFDPANAGVYIWDNAQSKYVAHSLVSSEKGIPPGQGFFVKVKTGITQMIFNEAQRSTQGATGTVFQRQKTLDVAQIQLFLSNKKQKVNTQINYLESGTKGIDKGYDLENYPAIELDVYTQPLKNGNNKDLTIQSLPTSEIGSTILPIGLQAKKGEKVTFSVKLKNIPEYVAIFLEDKETNTFTKFDKGNTYTVNFGEAVNGYGRFYLHTKSSILNIDDINNEDIKVYQSEANLVVKGISEETFKISVFNLVGQEVATAENENTLKATGLTAGVYMVKVKTALKEQTIKILVD
ncbi:T9SS type A sorting domain-containing protein [Tenacibaculum sp. 190524A02b]|uniref:T9SS type A sorting domain-containing protein n=1 Tax=Tenacibaculum vairaonense TaxID=3137860 RepID=UPI0031FB5B63